LSPRAANTPRPCEGSHWLAEHQVWAYKIGTLIEMIPEEMALTEDQKENVAHALEYFRILLREGMSRSEAFERASQHLDFIERQANNETIGEMQSVFAELAAEIT
jgi:hypothetical protein